MSCYPTWFSTLCRRNSPFRFFPFGVLLPWQVRQHVCLQSAGLLLWLGWRGLCYITWFSPMCHALPQGLQLAQPSQLQATLGFFRSPGVCPSASLVAWVGLQPSPSFSGLLLLRLLAGVGGVMHPVSGAPVAVVSAWFAGAVTLLPFPYLRVSVLLACGVSGVCGLRRRSRLPFVVRHGLGFVDRVLWPLVGPGTCCFLDPSLGSSLSLPGWLLA